MGNKSWIWQGLSVAELDFTEEAARELESVSWAAPLLDHARQRGHLPSQIRAHGPQPHRSPQECAFLSDFFEIRFAFALASRQATATYEYEADVGETSVDFRVEGDPPWLVELVTQRVTDAVENATLETEHSNGRVSYSLFQSSDAEDEKNTPGYEMYVAQSKIAEKVFSNGTPVKFPEPCDHLHMVVVDMRGYNAGDDCDEYDYLQIAVGPQHLPDMNVWCAMTPNGKALRGLFEEQCPLRAAETVRNRLHFITFVKEEDYARGELRKRSYHANNPFLLSDVRLVREALNSWPLRGCCRPIVLPSCTAPRPEETNGSR